MATVNSISGEQVAKRSFEHRIVPVRRFNEELRATGPHCFLFQPSDRCLSFGRLHRQVAVEGELLSVQTGSGKGEERAS